MIKYPILATIWAQGNSYVVTIPRTIINANLLKEGDQLHIDLWIEEK